MKLTFWGKVGRDGTPGVYQKDRERFVEACKSKPGREFKLTLTWPGEKRSLDQNSYIHWAFEFIARELAVESFESLSPDDVKTIAKIALIPVPRVEVVDRLAETWESSEEFPTLQDYRDFLFDNLPPVGRPTSGLTVEECRDFIDRLVPWAWQMFRVKVPYPNEVEVY